MKVDLFKEVNSDVYKENEMIKAKLKEYTHFFNIRGNYRAYTDISYNDLRGRFSAISAKINNLVQREAPINEITPKESYRVKLEPATRQHFRIESKLEPIPLKICIEMDKGVKGGKIYISQMIMRPLASNSDKTIVLSDANIISSYTPSMHKKLVFTDRNIFITFEADKAIVLKFQCVFGRCISLFITL